MSAKEITIKNLKLLKKAWEENNFEPVMEYYGGISGRNKPDLKLEQVNECGTCCCILGYAPNVEGLEITEDDFDSDDNFSYILYSDRIFPELRDVNNAWSSLFCQSYPNSKKLFFSMTKLHIQIYIQTYQLPIFYVHNLKLQK